MRKRLPNYRNPTTPRSSTISTTWYRSQAVDHVGLGSDFDGATMPEGMEDCTKVPLITDELVRRGYSEGDIRKILGENFMRVMEEVLAD